MSESRGRFEDWRESARRKAREMDERFSIRERMEEGARVAQEAARKGAEFLAAEAERARARAGQAGEDFEVRENARRAAEEAAQAARRAAEVFSAAGRSAGQRANEVFDDARAYYDKASQFYGIGTGLARTGAAVTCAFGAAYDWARSNPGKAVAVSISIATGIRLGAAFPGLDATLLGSHPHWLTHSAIPVWALRAAGERIESHLQSRVSLLESGHLSEAERQRIEFQRKIVRYVGAPMLGAFSCAVGVALWAQIAQPGHITGAPISWVLGGNPLLEGFWLFGNGIICFYQGYKFFMIALANQGDAARIVRELKGLLPAFNTV